MICYSQLKIFTLNREVPQTCRGSDIDTPTDALYIHDVVLADRKFGGLTASDPRQSFSLRAARTQWRATLLANCPRAIRRPY